MIQDTITFRPLRNEDLPLLHEWLNRPHMRDHYQPEPVTLEEVGIKFIPRIYGTVPTYDHIVLLAGKPIGKMQCYRNLDYPEYAGQVGLNEGISVDLFIGEPDMLGQGIGHIMLGNYVEDVALPLYPQETKCFICHALTNARAIACSKSAGFQSVRPVTEDGVKCELLVFFKKN